MITLGVNKLDNQLNTKPQFIPERSKKNKTKQKASAVELAALIGMALKQTEPIFCRCAYVITWYLAR